MSQQQADKMISLQQRIDGCTHEIESQQKRRDALALDAAQGSKQALREITQCDAALEAAFREQGLLLSALDQLKQLSLDEQQAILDKANAEHQAKAAATANSIVRLNDQVDSRLNDLCNLLKTRAELLHQLQGMRVTDPGYLNKMHKDAVTAAFAFHGLSKYADIHNPSPNALRALASSNHFLSGISAKPAVERIKTKEDA
jgi:hypothetical protein